MEKIKLIYKKYDCFMNMHINDFGLRKSLECSFNVENDKRELDLEIFMYYKTGNFTTTITNNEEYSDELINQARDKAFGIMLHEVRKDDAISEENLLEVKDGIIKDLNKEIKKLKEEKEKKENR